MEIIRKYFDALSSKQWEQFGRLKELYTYWNEQINVISRKDLEALYERHVLHSLTIPGVFAFENGIKVVDIGTGGGFPGIPLAIFYPEVEFLLVDSIGKKIKVVREIIHALGLKNARALHSRIEDIPENDFDLAVSRAVAPLEKLGKWSRLVLNKNGNQGLICLKGGDLQSEIKEARLKTKTWEIHDVFPEPFFVSKKLLWSQLQ
jgi:16S rRNA (guanine527-N7)-methyltransferase